MDTEKSNDTDIQVLENGGWDIKTLGKDPYVFVKPLNKALDLKHNQLSFSYFCPTGLDHIQVYFYPLGKQIRSVMSPEVGSTEGWVDFRIDLSDYVGAWGRTGDFLRMDFGTSAGINIQVKNIKLREMTARELEIQASKEFKKQQELMLESNLQTYLDQDFSNQVSNVLITDNKVTLTGKVVDNTNLYIAEIPVYENSTALKIFTCLEPIKNNNFEIDLNRFVERDGFKQDRLLSKWMIVEKINEQYLGVSHARYTDSVVPKYNDTFTKLTSKKGLGGYSAHREAPVSDLDSLGITSATVNIWINGLLRSKPSKDNMAFEYLGKTFYINKKKIEKYDETMRSTSARNIEVSAILLVAKASQSTDKVIGDILQHPDTDPAGIYAMPNVTSPKGVQYYSAILDFLAKRYSRPDKKYGRIHHYIIHNEVDAGWVWTNAGEKSALVFMDLYHKSMRMSHNIARKYNPNSKVFISLTHYWNWTSNPRFYHSKALLELLLKYSKTEGDFEWAIAQHPYPESLREPKTWLDKKVNFDFDTQLITFKNIEVLDAWVKQPEVLFKGKTKRLVYLSENGTNSPTYSEKDLKEQAAGMAYAMKKIKYLDGIDAFQYHNWQDNRKEGGLRIGLRRFPDDKENPGGIKPVWKVYQAFGTEKEDDVYDQYKAMIGVKNWNEIRYEVNIDKNSGAKSK
ncbi:DUF5722 domain-containing protein [Algibacter pacificus]|uniref:DUF5722 domain-containing protein n=1 Tax=Algibacter pacificus TaxID=2599389 RepID=UPI0011CB8A01|nr:DUF5722 domain-containing protein [Algibacter pacificus]